MIYSLVGQPVQTLLCLVGGGGGGIGRGGEVGRVFRDHFARLRGVKGTMWFCALLLIFDLSHVCIRRHHLPPKSLTSIRESLNGLSRKTIVLLFLDIVTSFLLRLEWPMGSTIQLIALQPAFLPQYVISYVLGARDVPPVLSPSDKTWLVAGSLASTLSFACLLYLYPDYYSLRSINSGPNLLALSYAVWSETTGALIADAIFRLFGEIGWLRRKWAGVGKYSYVAFLVHPVVCVGLQRAAEGWMNGVGGVVKTIVVGSAVVVGSWVCGWSLAKVPAVGGVVL